MISGGELSRLSLALHLALANKTNIPTLVFDGLCDGGIIGENVLFESALRFPSKIYRSVLTLGNCRCRLAIARRAEERTG